MNEAIKLHEPISHDMSIRHDSAKCHCRRCRPFERPCDCSHCREYEKERQRLMNKEKAPALASRLNCFEGKAMKLNKLN